MGSDKNALSVIKAFEGIDSSMFHSKKFTGFLLIEITWKLLLAHGIYAGMNDTVLLAMVAAAGTTETAFMGVMGWHDKHVKTAKATAMNGSVTKTLTAPSTEAEDTDAMDSSE